ncbi:hypothetical protein D6D20_09309 [Aureobasidium pullulans]|uniref:Uncharacterized protein n=1 Tax=Aureobasidium pullulans TaxID=5580 RepID=A0A4S8YPC6_AURPU|nr:hypothetical protein D6D20_09309 [Aureobasidium pullulans]
MSGNAPTDPVGILQMFRLLNAYSSQQTEDQRPQGPSEDDLRYMIHDLDLLQAACKLRLFEYTRIVMLRKIFRPSTPVPAEIVVEQLSAQQILNLRRILEHDNREASLLTDLRECNTRHSCQLAEVEKALKSAKEVADPGFWELINAVHQRYFLLINQNKLLLQLRAIALIPASPIGQSLSLLTLIIREALQDTPPLHAHSTTTTALSPQTSQPVIAASSHYWRLLCIPCHRLPSIAMTTPQITLNDTGQLDSSGDTQEHAAAQPGQSEEEAEIVVDPNSSEAAEQIYSDIFQKIYDVVEQHGDETRETRWSMYVTDPASASARWLEEQSSLLRNRELSTLSRSEIAISRTMVQYETRLALELTSFRVSSLKAVDALETVCRENERNISRLDAIAPSSLAPVQILERVLRRDLRSTIAREIQSIMARAREVVMKGPSCC